MPAKRKTQRQQVVGMGGRGGLHLAGMPGVRSNMHGNGFFDDVWSGIKSVGSFVGEKVLPKVLEVGAPLLIKAAMGGAGKRRRRK